MKASPIKRKKSLLSPNKNSVGGQVFYDVPDEYQSHQIPEDEMRFLKSFERYTNSRHFTIHRKMSQGAESTELFNK
jgi:hypothetical protein